MSAMDLKGILKEAHSLHMQGFNCAESTLWGLSKYWGLEIDASPATGLGGGIARTGGMCGALLGAILAVGKLVGRKEPQDEAKKTRCYALAQKIIQAFSEDMGSRNCQDIIGFVLGSEGGSQRYAQGNFKEGKCKSAIEAAIIRAIQVAND